MNELSNFQQDGVVDVATSIMNEAYQSLIYSGKTPEDAEFIVKTNFKRVNKNPLLLLNIKELCRFD